MSKNALLFSVSLDNSADEVAAQADLPYRARKRPAAWLTTVLVPVLIAWFAINVSHTDTIHFSQIPKYLFDPRILHGVAVTLELTVTSLCIGIVIGLFLACARLSKLAVARAVSSCYIWFFLSIPGLVQLIFWFNLAIIFPRIALHLPFLGTIWETPTNSIITAMTASMIGLGLHEAANFAEVIRSGILSIPKGQVEAAQSLGIRSRRILFSIVLPQALRVMLPPSMARLVALMKDTSLVAVIGGGDLMTHAQEIYSDNFMILELLVVVSAWYLFMVSILMLAQSAVELWASKYQKAASSKTSAAPVENAA